MKLRVVTPTLGHSAFLAEARASIAAIDPAAEHVIVCPGERREAVAAAAPGAVVLAQERPGLYPAINQGLRAPGDWEVATYLNDDDRLEASGTQRALLRLAEEADVSGAFGRVALVDSGGAYLAEIPVARRGADLGPLLAGGIIPLAQPGTIFRRRVWESLGGFGEHWQGAGDLDFFVRAWRANHRFLFVNVRVASFRVHRGQISKRVDLVAAEKESLVTAARREAGWIRAARGARWRFRADNLGAYFDRLRRHGWVTMADLYATE